MPVSDGELDIAVRAALSEVRMSTSNSIRKRKAKNEKEN